MEKEEALALGLAATEGLGRKSIYRLLEEAESFAGIFGMNAKELSMCIGTRAAKVLENAFEGGPQERVLQCIEKGIEYEMKNRKEGISCITCVSNSFPQRLHQIPDPPFALYLKGKFPREDEPTVAVIGARACSAYGRNVAYQFSKELAAAGVGIVSGMARGIDGIAQEGAIDSQGATYAVLGSGVDICYPPEHGSLYETIPGCGGIVSEYRPGVMPRTNFFPERNRIISGLADIVLVIEARKRSGTYITVTQALEQGKDVFAVPGRVTDLLSDGCNCLIRDGAGLADCAETILSALRCCKRYDCLLLNGKCVVSPSKGCSEVFDGNSSNKLRTVVWKCLEITPIHINELYERVRREEKEIVIPDLLSELVYMELEGCVEGRGSYYVRKEGNC